MVIRILGSNPTNTAEFLIFLSSPKTRYFIEFQSGLNVRFYLNWKCFGHCMETSLVTNLSPDDPDSILHPVELRLGVAAAVPHAKSLNCLRKKIYRN